MLTPAEDRRVIALNHAVTVASMNCVDDSIAIVKKAEDFDAFLRGNAHGNQD